MDKTRHPLMPLHIGDARDSLSGEIDRYHPTSYEGDGVHETYAQAMELVHNRHSKGALVDLVHYLLMKNKELQKG